MNCRLLYLVGQLGPGGLERQLYLLLQTMDRDRYRPEVVVWNFQEDDTYVNPLRVLGVRLHFFPPQYSRRGKLKAFRDLVSKLHPEIVHSYSFYTNVAAWWGTLGRKAIAFGAVRSNFINDRRSCGLVMGMLSARWPETLVFNSFVGAENARKSRSLFAPRKIMVVRNGLDLVQFRKVTLPLTGRVRILGVGSLVGLKRWDRLLSAASELQSKGLDCEIEIAGDGPLRGALERQVRQLGLSDRVRLRGYTDDIPGLLGASTFLAHPSDVEGCPNVVMEAMACGRPVVATDAGDVVSLIDDGKTGFVVHRGNDRQFAERLETLTRDRRLCRQMGDAGRDKAERQFGSHRLVAETMAVYRTAGWKDM